VENKEQIILNNIAHGSIFSARIRIKSREAIVKRRKYENN